MGAPRNPTRRRVVTLDREFALRTHVVLGAGLVERVGEVARRLGGRRVLLVTDAGLVGAGHAMRAEKSLEAAGVAQLRFDGVRENPTSEDVDRCVAAARDFDPDLIIGLGGGSPIDVAKGANFVMTNGGTVADYRGRGKAAHPLLPLVAVPTTAGTGTETQSFALIADPVTHHKMACGDPKAAPRVALLDPTLTTTMPRFVTACTGLDAIGHAVECAVTRVRTEASVRFAVEAFSLASAALPRVLAVPDDLQAREDMLRAAAYAGIAIENSMLGAAHSMANPLTARHGVAHGQAVGMALPHVVRFNAENGQSRAIYAELAGSAEALADRLEELIALAGMPASLASCGVAPEGIDRLATEAAEQWTAGFNPRTVGEAEFRVLFRTASA